MGRMKQGHFLQLAKRELGLTYPALANELGVSARAMEKWSIDPASPDHRAMPLIATRFIARLLEERKRAHLAAGNRAAAETIDAMVAQMDPQRLAASLRTFDALQRAARALAVSPARRKPAFRTFAAKNAWEREEETRHARRARAPAARNR